MNRRPEKYDVTNATWIRHIFNVNPRENTLYFTADRFAFKTSPEASRQTHGLVRIYGEGLWARVVTITRDRAFR